MSSIYCSLFFYLYSYYYYRIIIFKKTFIFLWRRGAFFGSRGGYEVPLFYLPNTGDGLKVPDYDW